MISKRNSVLAAVGLSAAMAIGIGAAPAYSAPTGSITQQQLVMGTGGWSFHTLTRLNLRKTPSCNGKVLAVIPAWYDFTSDQYLGESGDGWIKVSYKGLTGWASGYYMMQDDYSTAAGDYDGERLWLAPHCR